MSSTTASPSSPNVITCTGEMVALGTIAQLVTEATDEKIMAVAETACAPGDTIHDMPFKATPQTVAAVIRAADAFGHHCIGE